jgi:FdhD protein
VKTSDPNGTREAALAPVLVYRISRSGSEAQSDSLAVEEPLEIRLACRALKRRVHVPVSITMRTPGHDPELAVGFLFTEGILRSMDQLVRAQTCSTGNVVCVELQPDVDIDLSRLERHFYASSSCGVCGKASLEALRLPGAARIRDPGKPVVDADIIYRLPESLRSAQTVFARTGGLHAAALFDVRGDLVCISEDVGRHNALDKLIGSQFLADRVPLLEGLVLLSGRASFELIQKAAAAGIPIVAAVGAPSSLAVALAQEHCLTLVGFVNRDRFNIYSRPERIRLPGNDEKTALRTLELGI